MQQIADLLSVADAYKTGLGIEDTTVSARVFNDSKKLSALRAGADITIGRFNSALRWFDDNWPDGVRWPVQVQRPHHEEAEG